MNKKMMMFVLFVIVLSSFVLARGMYNEK